MSLVTDLKLNLDGAYIAIQLFIVINLWQQGLTAFAVILFLEENIMVTIENVMEYYKSYDEEGRLLLRYGLVEYLTTMKYIKIY